MKNNSGTMTSGVSGSVTTGDQRGESVVLTPTAISLKLRAPACQSGTAATLRNEAADAIDALVSASRHAIFPLEWARNHIDPIVSGKVQANIDAINDAIAKTRGV